MKIGREINVIHFVFFYLTQGRQFQTRDGIYRGINRYKPSCHKQVSDTQNVQNCHKQVLNNKTVWNCVSDILQYITYVMTEKNFFFHFHQVILLYYHQCISFWLIIYLPSHFIIFISHNHHCPKLSETVLNWRYIQVQDIVYDSLWCVLSKTSFRLSETQPWPDW